MFYTEKSEMQLLKPIQISSTAFCEFNPFNMTDSQVNDLLYFSYVFHLFMRSNTVLQIKKIVASRLFWNVDRN